MRRRGASIALSLAAASLAVLLALMAAFYWPAPAVASSAEPLVITVRASRYSYEPGVVRLEPGQRVTLRLEATDLAHGLILPEYGLELWAWPGHPAEVSFVADREGRFTFRCALPCGDLHPFMVGTLQVGPSLGLGAAAGLALPLTGLAAYWSRRLAAGSKDGEPADDEPTTDQVGTSPAGWDLLRIGLVRALVFSRWPAYLLSLLALGGLMVAIVAGLWGSPLGSHNAAIVLVWILWWALLALVLVPLGGRAWCAICPLPLPGEWLRRRSVLGPRPGKPFGWGLSWPRWLNNAWLQNAAFLGLAVLSAAILTRPALTAGLLVAVLLVATGTPLVFQGRAFCRYLCPLGGFIGLYSQAAPLGLRVRDASLCRDHREKECLRGSARGYGCPWGTYPGTLTSNRPCGLCGECLRTCPKDNVGLYLRWPAWGPISGPRSYAEAVKAVVLVASAALYTAVATGPWGWLKALAWPAWRAEYALYGLGLVWLGLVGLPALLWAAAWAEGRLGGLASGNMERASSLAYALIPLGLAAWMAFTLSFVAGSASYVLVTLSDPLGLGWNLLGTRDLASRPLLSAAGVQTLSAALLLLGMAWSAWLAAGRLEALRERHAAALPAVAVTFGIGLVFLWLHLGG